MSLGVCVRGRSSGGVLGARGLEGLWAEQVQSGECVHRKACLELLGGGPEEAAVSRAPTACFAVWG